jgi:hypothetical protein
VFKNKIKSHRPLVAATIPFSPSSKFSKVLTATREGHLSISVGSYL